jgi:hypothetical protein
MMQGIRKFMLSSPAWVIFVLTAAGYLFSVLARIDSIRVLLNPLFLLVMSDLPPVFAALWYFSAISGANRAQSQIKQSTVTVTGILLVFYATLPLFSQVILAYSSSNGLDSTSSTVTAILVFWGIIAGVGMLFTAYIASRLLFTFMDGGNPGPSHLVLGFLGFWIYPVGLWFLQPKLNRLAAHLMGVPPNKRL